MKSFLCLACGVLMLMNAHAADVGPAPNVQELMKNVVATQAQVIWDIGNTAQDDEGNPDGSKLKAADWAQIVSAAGKMKNAATALARAEHVMAAAPGQKLEGEGNPGAFNAKAVQKAIDANPKLFRSFAQQLAVNMEEIAAAARAHDAAKLSDASGRLDQICEQCHMRFWYPDQNAPR